MSERCTAGWVLFSLILICAAVNLTKAIHIDDTAYLEVARAIRENPLHPMTAEINWSDTAEPVSSINQPHLFFYALALVMSIFGESELALHGLMVLITSIAIISFYLLARLLVHRHALFLTALFVLGPAFLPGQNLMVEMPLIALWLIFFWSIFSAAEGRPISRYLIGAVVVAMACLIKYTSLVLLPIFVFAIIRHRRWRYLWFLAVPVTALGGWSLFNYFDYGAVHFLQRDVGVFSATDCTIRAVEWIAGLGSVASFSVIFLSPASRRRAGGWLFAGSIFAGVLIISAFYTYHRIPWRIASLWTLFISNGIFTLALASWALVRGVIPHREKNDRLRLERNAILGLWVAGTSSFIVIFAPFMAVRHILLAVPAILLLLGYNLEHFVERRWGVFGLIVTASLGILLALSDYHYAGLYRYHAPRVARELPPGATIWYAGHWGWQWYAQKEGMQQYDKKRTVFRDGNYLVVPLLVDREWSPLLVDWQCIPEAHRRVLKKVREAPVKAGLATLFRTMSRRPWGGYYCFSLRKGSPPWRFSTAPLDTFSIFVAVESDDTPDALR